MVTSPRHVHLDLLGGIAGDMFVAAILDAFPELRDGLAAALAADEVASLGRLSWQSATSAGIAGLQVSVDLAQAEAARHDHRSYRDIQGILAGWPLDAPVRNRAEAIFEALARAEATIHGVDAADVVFHEVGAVDSIMDIVAGAWLIEALGACSWSCSPIPMGTGRVRSDHGPLPVPAPATAMLIQGMPVFVDGVAGERVTPTGAALLCNLAPSFDGPDGVMALGVTGHGIGSRLLDGMANILRVLAFDTVGTANRDEVLCCTFEVDDQTPEDLAFALDHLRSVQGVVDVLQVTAIGKQGRVCAHIQVLAVPEQLEPVVDTIFRETTTLGLRWQRMSRRTLRRDVVATQGEGAPTRVKLAARPDGVTTAKAEMVDVAPTAGGHEGRRLARDRAEAIARDDYKGPLDDD